MQGPGVLPNRGDKSIYKRDKKKWAVGSRVKGGHLNDIVCTVPKYIYTVRAPIHQILVAGQPKSKNLPSYF